MSGGQKLEMKIVYCSCPNAYQDKRFGNNMRAHNPRQSKKFAGQYRCTSCGSVRGAS